MKHLFLSIIVTACILCVSCEKENAAEVCQATKISMLVNGELHTFQALGRGIDLTKNGYRLHLNFDRRDNNPLREQGIALVLRYKKKGDNIIENFIYHQYINGVAFDGDFVNGELKSKVISNNKSCFYMKFSGKLSDGNQEIVITEGIISYEYEEPFDE